MGRGRDTWAVNVSFQRRPIYFLSLLFLFLLFFVLLDCLCWIFPQGRFVGPFLGGHSGHRWPVNFSCWLSAPGWPRGSCLPVAHRLRWHRVMPFIFYSGIVRVSLLELGGN